jgi:branched-chain amino acid aminotransferase
MENKNKIRLVWLNGTFVPEEDARISIFDSALVYGDMIFEMMRSFNKVQFRLKEHIERLFAGVKILRIPLTITPGELEKQVYETIERNEHLFKDDDEHRVMIDISRGALPIYHEIKDIRKEPNVVISVFPLKWAVKDLYPLYQTGVNAVIPSQRSIPASLMDPKIKSRSRLYYKLAALEVANFPGKNNWPLLIDADGLITEGTGDNFFIIKNNVIYTPEGRNILRGISRGYVFELAEQLNLKCVEKNIFPYDVYTADEAFMTATRYCIMPVTGINGLKIGTGVYSGITKLLLEAWGKNVGVDIIGQFKKYYEDEN